jgi:hypothetical protein
MSKLWLHIFHPTLANAQIQHSLKLCKDSSVCNNTPLACFDHACHVARLLDGPLCMSIDGTHPEYVALDFFVQLWQLISILHSPVCLPCLYTSSTSFNMIE